VERSVHISLTFRSDHLNRLKWAKDQEQRIENNGCTKCSTSDKPWFSFR